jgi:hypothetical protein
MISATRLLTPVTAVSVLAICLAGSVQAAPFRVDLTVNSVQDGKIDASIGRKGGSLNPLVIQVLNPQPLPPAEVPGRLARLTD